LDWIRTFRIVGWLLLIPAGLVGLAVVGFVSFEVRKAYWDSKVTEMCKQGGIKVFQRVQLDSSEYQKLLNERNQLNLRSEKLAGSDETYVYSIAEEYIVRGHLEVSKSTQRVLKMPERTILSEHVSFSRVGGDFFPIAHSTSFSCAKKESNLFEQTFSKRKEGGS
jgi:hypothetical protein